MISAYHDGTELIQHIKAKRKAKRALQDGSAIDTSTQELEQSLKRGEVVIGSQYDRDFKRFGDSFALGDRMHAPPLILPSEYICSYCTRGFEGCLERHNYTLTTAGYL